MVLVLGRVIDVLADEVADRSVVARIRDRIEREVTRGTEQVEKRADKPWLN